MLISKTLRKICTLLAFASLVGFAIAPAVAGETSKLTANANRAARITADGETPLGPKGPQGTKSPLISIDNGRLDGLISTVRIGSARWPLIVKIPFEEKGTFLTTGQPSFFQKPLETTVTAIKGNAIIIDTPTGKGTIQVPPGRLAASGIEVGTKITVTADNRGATVHLRAAIPRTPYAGIYVGELQSSGDTYIKLRLRGGAVQTFSANREVGRIARTLNGKTIALQSSDGRSARTLLTAQQLNGLLNAISKSGKPVGKILTANPQAQVVWIAPSPQPRCALPFHQPNAMPKQKAAPNALPCDYGSQKRNTVRQTPAGIQSSGVVASRIPSMGGIPAVTACAHSDSGGIFIMLRHWRSRTPVSGASVNLSGPASVTLASPPSGYIELLNVPSGAYRLTIQKDGLKAMETSEFHVTCNDALRVQAQLQTARRMVRVIRIQKRRLVFRVVSKQKTPLNCFYGSLAAHDLARELEKTFVVKSARGYYTCGLKRVPVWKKLRR